jgi:hypothetical protein
MVFPDELAFPATETYPIASGARIMPFDAVRDPTPDLLKENFNYWLRQWNPLVEPNLEDCIGLRIATTTTFSAENPPDTTGHPYPYRAILFEDEALLSNQELRLRGRIEPGSDRPMEVARAVKLDQFVFAYLGVHDPFYARQTGRLFATKAFGVFLGVDLDVFPKCNATRRDLAACTGPPQREFLLPRDARLYSHYQVLNDPVHFGDFWHYWGSYPYWKDADYRTRHWTWKVEFHYRTKIPVGKLEAILWPVEFVAARVGRAGHARLDSESRAEIRLFRSKYPRVFVIPYIWDSAYHTFVNASYAVVVYVLKHGTYPDNADLAISEL